MTSIVYDTIIAPLKVINNKTKEYLESSENVQPERIFDPPSLIDKLTSLFNNPIHIVDGIYLGNAINAASYYKLKELDVGLIVNVTKEIENYFEGEFEYLKFPVLDNGLDDLSLTLIESYEKILEYKKNNPFKNIVVHCYMGASRSVSVIVYYLIKQYSMTFEESIEVIKNKKHIINISTLFKKNICDLI